MKKGAVPAAPINYEHNHSLMNDTTKEILRNSVLEALSRNEDQSALELLQLLTEKKQQPCLPAPVVTQQVLALPAERFVTEGPARDYHFWARHIRENFIPWLTNNGRQRFTSKEVLTWIEKDNTVGFTSGDIKVISSGRETWRDLVGNGLRALKDQGVLRSEAFSKRYQIV